MVTEGVEFPTLLCTSCWDIDLLSQDTRYDIITMQKDSSVVFQGHAAIDYKMNKKCKM